MGQVFLRSPRFSAEIAILSVAVMPEIFAYWLSKFILQWFVVQPSSCLQACAPV